MALVLVERRFDQPVEFEDIQKLEDAASWCLDAHKVRFIKTFFSRDQRRMLCLYEAPDAEAVRLAEDQACVPYDRAWTCTHLPAPAAAARAGKETVIVERAFSEPITAEFASSTFKRIEWCLDLHRATYLESYLANDGMSMVCVFHAPDAEAVRLANTRGGAPFKNVWTAGVHG